MSYPQYYNNYAPHQIYGQGPQAGPSGGYGGIYAPPATNPYYAQQQQPAQTPFIPPNVMLETPPPSQSQPVLPQAAVRPKHSNRVASTPLPLKSALKKTGANGAAVPATPYAEPMQPRRRTTSRVKPDKYAFAAATSQNFNQVEMAEPNERYHMFVTFKGDSELLLENTIETARKEISQKIVPLWPHGLETSHLAGGTDWTLKFKNAPWNMSGPDVAIAWKMIAALFTLFAVRGFNFLTSTKCTTTQPRLLFQITNSDRESSFFLAYFSRGGRRVTLINPPHHIAVAFGPKLRAFLPNQVEVIEEKDLLMVETKRQIGGVGVKHSHFLMQILKAIASMHFDLNATVTMARGGPLGMGSRRELFVFKGIIPEKQ